MAFSLAFSASLRTLLAADAVYSDSGKENLRAGLERDRAQAAHYRKEALKQALRALKYRNAEKSTNTAASVNPDDILNAGEITHEDFVRDFITNTEKTTSSSERKINAAILRESYKRMGETEEAMRVSEALKDPLGEAESKDIEQVASKAHDKWIRRQRQVEMPVLGRMANAAESGATWMSSKLETPLAKTMLETGVKLAAAASAFAIFAKYSGLHKYLAKVVSDLSRPTVYEVEYAIPAVPRWPWQRKATDLRRGLSDLIYPRITNQTLARLVDTTNRYADRIRAGDKSLNKISHPVTLFYGPPGTGKTSAIKAIAKEIGWNCILLVPDNFNELKTESDRIAVLKEMFARAKKMGNTIIAFDEIEEMTRSRSNSSERNPFLNILLEQLNELKDPKTLPHNPQERNVMFMAATNNIRGIEPALLSRFDYKIELGAPNIQALKVIFDTKIGEYITSQGLTTSVDTIEMARILREYFKPSSPTILEPSGRDVDSILKASFNKLIYLKSAHLTDEIVISAMEEAGLVTHVPRTESSNEIDAGTQTEEFFPDHIKGDSFPEHEVA